ncbi:MAG TPA: hypothetical protein VFQ53_30515 [Kofleriaceae bacterium]|nr:hypothetical protein [Kofleriaceae bacterium]
MTNRSIYLLLVLVAGCAKNVRRDQALAQANAARARGDIVGEAMAMRDACSFAPDDRDVCQRASATWVAAQAATQQNARRACADIAPTQGAIDACLASASQFRKLAPNDPEGPRLSDAGSRQHLARCFADSPAWQTSLDAAIDLVRCEDARADLIDLPVYTQQVMSARANARDQLLALVDNPAYLDRPGATAELLTAATCLAGDPSLAARTRSARAAFVDRARASIDLRVATTTPLPDLCATAASALSSRAVCGPPRAKAPQLTIVGDVTLAPVEHTAFDSTESKQYVAGIIRFENPEYQPAVEDERSARMAKDQAESTFRRDESDCRSAESEWHSQNSCSDCAAKRERDRACNAADASESLFRSRTSDWERARSHLSSTPPISEREDIRTATYTVRHHTWRTAWRAQLRNDGSPIEAGGETTADDLETAGAPVAGVPSDPMTYPGNRWFVAPIRDQVAAKLAETLDAALRRRAGDLAVSCKLPLAWKGDWLECWSRARFWGGGRPDGDALLSLVGERRADWGAAVRCTR